MKFPIIHVELANSTPCPRPAVPTEFLISKSNKLQGVSIIDFQIIFILFIAKPNSYYGSVIDVA